MRRLLVLSAFLLATTMSLFLGGSADHAAHFDHAVLDLLAPARALAQAMTFLFTFDGTPTQPQPFQPSNWDIQRNVSDAYRQVGTPGNGTWMPAMLAHHGSDCAPPMATHQINDVNDAVFVCGNHIMTSMNAGYGAIYLTPNAQADFSTGEAVVRFDMSTFSTVGRDWVDLWVTPYQENLALPLDDWLPPYQGPPRRTVHLRMDGTGSANNPGGAFFVGEVMRNFTATGIPAAGGKGFKGFLVPDAARRDTFELRISRTHVKFGMPAYNNWWVDSDIPDLGWDRGVVQFGHHAYNPTKGCDESHGSEDPNGYCANTWHWDNVQISPARPFTILRATPRMVHKLTPNQITFPQPSPANAHLRFAGIGDNLEVSFNGGSTWQPAVKQAQNRNATEHFKSYWTPMPAGVSSVLLRGQASGAGPWMVLDAAIWADSGSAPGPTITPTAPAATPTATAIPGATKTPTPSPTPVSTPGGVTCPCSIWGPSATPAIASYSETQPFELGVKFRSDVSGWVTGVRFYKGAGNTGTHTGSLWSSSGQKLASATFTNETASGWQQVTFATPVQVTAGTTYVVSYYAPNGRYAFNQGQFASAGVDNGPLHALSSSAGVGNGVFRSGSSGFPADTYQASNYWVDVVFSTTRP